MRILHSAARWLSFAAVVAVIVAVCSGCATAKKVDANRWARDYYQQPNCAEILSITGGNVEICVRGATTISLSTPVPPKTIIPRDPGVLDSIGGLFGHIMPWAAGMYIGGKLADRPASVDAQVVRPEVVNPVVIE